MAPQQERAERRVAGFLEVAAKLFAEQGYEAVTMTEVATQAGSSIGALYKYFPDKQALALTLALEYSRDLEEQWKPVIAQAANLSHREFAHLFIDSVIAFVQERPAYLQLVAAPVRFRRDPAARRASRQTIASALLVQNPALNKDQAFLIANITLQTARGMMTLLTEMDPKSKPAVIAEFKKVLSLYFNSVLSH